MVRYCHAKTTSTVWSEYRSIVDLHALLGAYLSQFDI
jgi:hypothetical protein